VTDGVLSKGDCNGAVMVARDFGGQLDALRPRIGNYNWLFAPLRRRYRKRGRLPWRMYLLMRRLGSPRKPLFVAQSSEGIQFVGDYRDWYSMWCAIDPDYDRTIIEQLRLLLAQHPGHYLDVGTNMGIVAASLARTLAPGREVLAFEPIASTASRAAASFALNGLANIRLFQCAIGEEAAELSFAYSIEHSEAATLKAAHVKGENWTHQTVRCTSLDLLVREGLIDNAGLIKFDVEGYELAAVRGAREMIALNKPAVVYEYNAGAANEMGWIAQDVSNVIDGAGGYDYRVLHDDGRQTPFPPPSSLKEIVNICCEPR
jgi:FkbM family methyltransferase